MLQETAKKEYNILMAPKHANEGIPAEPLSADEEISALIKLIADNDSVRGAAQFHEYVRNRIWKYLHAR
jgi:hypothetical protein